MKKLRNFIKNYPYKKMFLLITILFIGYAITFGYLTYTILLWHNIESIIRYAFIICLSIILLIFLLSGINSLIKAKKGKHILYIFFIVVFGAAQLIGASYIDKIYSSISKINKSKITYSTSLITLKNSNIKAIDDVKSKKIGLITDKTDMEGYIISQDILKTNDLSKKNTIVKYENFLSMLNDLYDKKIDALFISTNYPSMFSGINQFENLRNETKIIISKTKTTNKAKDENTGTVSDLNKPFTVLVLGIDSTQDNVSAINSFNGDSLMLVTFNPKTLNATILSIPRDTFVPIMCFRNHIRNKITHSGWQGESCVVSTIQNFTGVKIDYYLKINFKGVVNLVDEIGGIMVDIPYNFCEQNSNRQWGKNTVYVKKGYHSLTGEQALAFARNRHPNSECGSKVWTDYYSDDFVRGQNQQTVLRALLNKVAAVRDVNKIYQILDLIEKSTDTNLTTDQILSFYNIGKNIYTSSKTGGEVLNFEKLYLKTYGASIFDEGMGQELSDQVYFKGSLDDVVDAMNINLDKKDPKIIKAFSFSINEPYVEEVIGKGNYHESLVDLVPNFTRNYTKQAAINWGSDHGIPITFKTVDSSDSKYVQNQIINQNVPKNKLVDMINRNVGITLTIINKLSAPTKVNCTLDENEDDDLCSFPTSIGDKYSIITSWENKIIMSGKITLDPVSTDDESKNGEIISQSEVIKGTKVSSLPTEVVVKYYKYEPGPTEGD